MRTDEKPPEGSGAGTLANAPRKQVWESAVSPQPSCPVPKAVQAGAEARTPAHVQPGHLSSHRLRADLQASADGDEGGNDRVIRGP